MSGPVMSVTLPKGKQVSAATEKPWGPTLRKGHGGGGKHGDLGQQLDGGHSAGSVRAPDCGPWKRAGVGSLVKLVLN